MAWVGNSFQVPSAAWAIAGVLHQRKLISRVPTAEELADPGKPGNLGWETSTQESLPEDSEWQRKVETQEQVLLTRYLLGRATHRGGEIRAVGRVLHAGAALTMNVDPGWW